MHGDAMTAAAPSDSSALINSTTVPSFPVDDLIPRDKNVDFVKVDVEGAEYNALLGASQLIRRCRPTIISEFSPNTMPGISGVDGRTYLRFLLDFGYKMGVIEAGGTLRDCGTDAERVLEAFASSGVDHLNIIFD
jgi:hypothetical protein